MLPHIRLLCSTSLILLLAALGGCGVQDQLFGTSGGLLFQGFDTMAHPGRPVRAVAELRGGNFLSGMEGYLVGFYDRDRKIGEMRTDETGRAWIEYTPQEPGKIVLLARLEDPDVRKYAVEAVEILIQSCRPDDPMIVLDLDSTLVNDDFEGVLTGRAEPMPHSLAVVERLTRDNCGILYLTGRPTTFSELSKQWLRKYNYPLGPVLTHNESSLGLGVESYKKAQVQALRKEFSNMRYGVGDLVTDIRAYRAADMHAIMILHPDRLTEPGDVLRWLRDVQRLGPEVDVVTNWRQIEQVIFEGRRYPPGDAARMLQELADKRIKEILEEPTAGDKSAPTSSEAQHTRQDDAQTPAPDGGK